MAKEAIIEGQAVDIEEKSGPKQGDISNRIKLMLGLGGCVIGTVLMLGALVFGLFLIARSLPAENDVVQTMADIPVVGYVVPADKRAEIAMSRFKASYLNKNEQADVSMQNQLEASIFVGNLSGVGNVSIDLAYEGNSTGEATSGFATMDIGFGGVYTNATVEVVFGDGELYLRFADVPEILIRDMAEKSLSNDASQREIDRAIKRTRDSLAEKWYVYNYHGDLEYLVSFAEIFESEIDAIVANGEHAYEGTESIRGISVYRYSLDLEGMLGDLPEDVWAGMLGEGVSVDVSKFDAKIWLDISGRLVKVDGVLEYRVKTEDASYPVSVRVANENWNFGSVQEVEIPPDAEDLREILDIVSF